VPRGSFPPPATERAGSRESPGGEWKGRAERPPSPSQAAGQDDLILLGEFGRAHGLKGEVRLKSFTAEPAAIASYGPLVTDHRRRFVLKAVRAAGGGSPDMLVARVEGVATREAAEALNRLRLYVGRDQIPPPEAEDEFLAADLVGLLVEDGAGRKLGTVVAVPDYGGGDLLEIAPPRGPTALLPFTKAFVPIVDLARKRVVVDPPDDLFASKADERP
jgi:16S rRNA processing protein RimM